MTTPNTEPKPATDAEISGIAAWNCDCRFQAGKDRHTRECLMVFGPRLIARIDQEREMRRELVKALSDEVSACSHLVEDPESCRRLICVISQRAIARAAKMEEDNAK